jgi:hypothetical protein
MWAILALLRSGKEGSFPHRFISFVGTIEHPKRILYLQIQAWILQTNLYNSCEPSRYCDRSVRHLRKEAKRGGGFDGGSLQFLPYARNFANECSLSCSYAYQPMLALLLLYWFFWVDGTIE